MCREQAGVNPCLAAARAPSIIRAMTLQLDRPATRWALGACVAVAAAGVVSAVDDVTLDVARIEGAGWVAEDIAIRLDLPAAATGASAVIGRLTLAARNEELRNVRIECPRLELSAASIACPTARIAAVVPDLGAQVLTGRVVYGRSNGALQIDLAGLKLGTGQMRLAATLDDAGWRADVKLERAALEPLVKLARDWQLPLPQLSASGTATLALSVRGSPAALTQARLDAQVRELTANNESGSLATEKLTFDLQARLDKAGGDWRFDAAVQSGKGQAYAQPVFLDLGAHALTLRASGLWRADGTFDVAAFEVDHRDVAQGSGSASIRFDAEHPLRALTLDLRRLQFPGAFESYFQPLLLDTSFKSMQSAGAIAGRIDIAEGMPRSIDLHFDAVTVEDAARTLVLKELQGDWHWRDEPPHDDDKDDEDAGPVSSTPDSRLSWQSGVLLNLDLGATQLHFNTRGRQFRLLRPARIPVLDGALELETFRIRNVALPSVAFLVDATLQPISVRELCKAFGWPEFGGSVGGVISKLRMRDNVVTLGTTLQARVFDGGVTIKDLRLEQPFSQWPRFYASIALDNLDLELVTGAFSFGRITGRLSGIIDALQLFNWTPVAFDARLFTPPGDRSRHRISQRAVENIGSIGGGGAGVASALSSGLLRFFEDFNYDRIGLSCRLERDVCVMDGIAPAPNGGYYLVKGKGVPRIDVIGGAHRVDWPRLVQQLIAVTASEGPVVK